MSAKHQLDQAAEDKCLVRVYREGLEDGWADGYIIGTGPDFFALELVDKSIRYDGCNCVRYADVTRCAIPTPHAGFIENALRMRGLRQRGSLEVDLSSVSSLLRTAGSAFPVVTIHLETEDPDTCYIGRVSAVSGDQVELKLITPDAEWEDETER
ncbi:MAG: hypothetical protein V3S01_08785, partial [Dehalococcoidia bacterium]